MMQSLRHSAHEMTNFASLRTRGLFHHGVIQPKPILMISPRKFPLSPSEAMHGDVLRLLLEHSLLRGLNPGIDSTASYRQYVLERAADTGVDTCGPAAAATGLSGIQRIFPSPWRHFY